MKLDFFAPPSTHFSLKIRIPEVQRIVETQARVAWAAPLAHSDKYQVGFEFFEMSPIFRKWIEEYILVNETLNP
jgi:c-di-GMP-binding flagellar brake protein YcgR